MAEELGQRQCRPVGPPDFLGGLGNPAIGSQPANEGRCGGTVSETFDAIVPRSVRLAEAPSYGLPILAYQPNSPGALAYDELARQVLTQDGVALAV